MVIKNNSKRVTGFTIVEVVVVIAVIGILSTIVVFSYSAIRNGAKAEAVKTDLQTTASELAKYRTENGAYPTSSGVFVATIKQSNTNGSTVYTYNYEASDGGYCLQAVGNAITYHITDASTDIVLGACPATSAATTVTNRIKDPSVSVFPSTISVTGASATSSLVTDSAADSGVTYGRLTYTGSGGGVIEYTLNPTSIDPAISSSTTYTITAKLRPSKAIVLEAQYSWTNGGGSTTLDPSQTINAPANQWSKLKLTGESPTPVTVKVRIATAAGQSWSVGDTLDIDSIMLVEGSSAYQYRDGTSAGWSWNGAANDSSSSGPSYIE